MTVTDHELLDIIEEVTTTLGQIILTHQELTEGLLDQNQTNRSRYKIDSLKNQLEDEKEKLGQIRHQQQRKKELERIRAAFTFPALSRNSLLADSKIRVRRSEQFCISGPSITPLS